MNKQQVIELMQSSRTEEEWNANCSKVRKACGGYPEFWHSAIIASGIARRVAASYGSSTDMKAVATSRTPINNIYGRPTSMPYCSKGQTVVGVCNQGLGKKDMVCRSLEDMQRLYDSYAQGMALTLEWCIISQTKASIPVA
jgi:hypothetical protein